MPVDEKRRFRFGSFEFDTQCGQLRKDGAVLKLQGQPIQVLELLLEKPQQLVTREEIRRRLWDSDTFVDFDQSLNTAVKKLRQALGDEAETPRYIETLPKRGYRFIGEMISKESREPVLDVPPEAIDDNFKALARLVDEAVPAVRAYFPRRSRLKFAAIPVFLVIIAATYIVTRPAPMPRVVGSHQLTKTGFRKNSGPLTDGQYVYFSEQRRSGSTLMEVGIKGGEVAQLGAWGGIRGGPIEISKDGSEMLLAFQEPAGSRWDAWSQPLPNGPPRLLIREVDSPTWMPDGRGILFGRQEGSNTVLLHANIDGTDVERLTKLPNIAFLTISPDGKRIRFRVRGRDEIWEAGLDGSNLHAVLEHGWPGSWTKDGKYYFFTSWDGEKSNLWVVPEPAGWWKFRKSQPVQLTFGPSWIGRSYGNLNARPAISEDGKRIYALATEFHGELSVYDPSSRQFVPYLGGISACYVDFSRDGQWITYVSFPEGTLWRSKTDGSERRQLTWPPYGVVNPRWSPDGKLIVFTDFASGDRQHLGNTSRIYVVSSQGGEPLLLPTDVTDNEVGDPTWSPDGTAISFGVGGALQRRPAEIRIFDLNKRTSSKVPGSDGLWSPRWSPDGKYLLALGGMTPFKLMLFSFATKQWTELATGTYVGCPSWTRDSKKIVLRDYMQWYASTLGQDGRSKLLTSAVCARCPTIGGPKQLSVSLPTGERSRLAILPWTKYMPSTWSTGSPRR